MSEAVVIFVGIATWTMGLWLGWFIWGRGLPLEGECPYPGRCIPCSTRPRTYHFWLSPPTTTEGEEG